MGISVGIGIKGAELSKREAQIIHAIVDQQFTFFVSLARWASLADGITGPLPRDEYEKLARNTEDWARAMFDDLDIEITYADDAQ
ncbi:hypothetical protein WMF45_45285 [Sorangium sp. So ce448]|uniref:hypothetical protein n=1 Tax=Sorangium sp. So ce448 TaxID=3133314 RepID=UPI003F612528